MTGPTNTLGSPWPPLAMRPCLDSSLECKLLVMAAARLDCLGSLDTIPLKRTVAMAPKGAKRLFVDAMIRQTLNG
jgi:hypothetical protein